MSNDIQYKIQAMKNELHNLVQEKLADIAKVANEADLAVSICYDSPFQNLYLVNEKFMQDHHWEASDLENRDVEVGDWITSNEMDGY